MLKKIVIGLVGLSLVGGIAWAQSDPIADRIANRKESYRNYRVIKKVVDDKGAPALATEAAMRMVDLQKKFITMFPAGSDKGDTKALPLIWTDWAGFEKANKDAEAAAMRLVDATKGSDLGAVDKALKVFVDSCEACHDIYHKPK